MEYALVTVRVVGMEYELDMELPTMLPIVELKQKLMYTLKKHIGAKLQSFSSISLKYQNTILMDGVALADYQIWDGSILEVLFS